VPWVFRGHTVIAVSESTKRDLVRRGMHEGLIRVVPNGIDLDYFTPAPGARAARPTLVSVGRLKKYKRLDLIVDAVALLVGQGVDVDLLIVGDGDRRAALDAQVARLGLAGRVKLLGFVSDSEKRDVLRAAWVHVLTSEKEGWGISNLEAAACGTPCVASDSPGLRESVVHGETGLLVPHGDVAELAGALGSLIADPAIRERMARQGRAFAERYSWDGAADGVERVLREVVAGARRH
jgi:glycosyltransferase involved in cell wall biosynthesis